MPKVVQKEEKKSVSEEVIGKSEAQNPRVGHNNATPTVSAPQAPDPKPNPIPSVEPGRSARAHKPNPRYMDTIVKEIGNTHELPKWTFFHESKENCKYRACMIL